jgi:hypothetical protein
VKVGVIVGVFVIVGDSVEVGVSVGISGVSLGVEVGVTGIIVGVTGTPGKLVQAIAANINIRIGIKTCRRMIPLYRTAPRLIKIVAILRRCATCY